MKKIIISILICLTFIACSSNPTEKKNVREILPFGAENIIQLGNGWVQFDLYFKDEDIIKTFMYHKRTEGNGNRGFECVTKINEYRME